jgi:hypothetical protein
MNLNPSDHSPKNNIWIQLLEIQRAFLARVNGSKDTSPPSPAEPSEINPSRISQLHQRQNPQSQPPDIEMTYRGEFNNPSFFYKFSESFNLLESFIKAQSANDLFIALCNVGKNFDANFQKERSAEMLKHLNSNEGRIFLKHKTDSIIDDTTQQILRDLRLNSSNSGNQGNSTDNDLIESGGDIATQNEAETQPTETNPRDYRNSTDQKIASIIALFDTFIAIGLKHSARDLLLGMDEKFSKRLKHNPLAMITNERPFMIIDTAQDPKKSGIEKTGNLIDYSNWDSDGDPVINVPATLKYFTQDYILPKKINLKPVDKEIQPYLNKVIRELDYQQVYSDPATQFYLKTVQKGYVGEANDFLTRAIQDRFKAFPSDVLSQYYADKGEFDEFTDLLKWAVDKKFLPKPALQKTLIALITETNKLKDDPEKLLELSTKYQLLESLFDKLKLYQGNNTVDDLIIRNADEIVRRFNNQQNKLERSLSTLAQDRNLLKRSLEVDPSQAPNYEKLQPDEKESSGKGLAERLSGMTVPGFLDTLSASSTSEAISATTQASSANAHLHNTREPSKKDVSKALREIYIQSALEISDGGGDEILDAIYIPRESLIAELNSSLDQENITLEQINKALNRSLDQEKIILNGIDCIRITSEQLKLPSMGTVINEAFLEFTQERQVEGNEIPIDLLDDDVSFDRFNNIVLKKLIKIQEEQPNVLRFILEIIDPEMELDKDLGTQDPSLIVDASRYPEIFVNRETEFYKNAPNKELDGSFKFITDEKVRNQTIGELISFFHEKKHSGEIRELTPESKTLLNDMINDDLYFSSPTAADRIAFLYFSLLESNLKKEANIILYDNIADALFENSESNNERLVSLLPVLKYAKENGYLANFKNCGQEINFNEFDHLLQYSFDQNNEAAQKDFQQDFLDKIANPKISHQEILRSLELLYSNQGLNNDELKSRYQESLLKRLLAPEKLINSPLYLENNLPDLIRLAVTGKKLQLLNQEHLRTFQRRFQAEDLVRLTPTELVKDFFKNSPELINALGSGIENSFKAIQDLNIIKSKLADDPSWIKILNSNTHLINNLESLVDKAFTLDNQRLTEKLTIKLREEILSLEINPDNAAAHLSLLNCIFGHVHDLSDIEDNKNLKAKYSDYLDLPLGLKENLDEPVDLRIMLIAKMEEGLQSFEKLLEQNKTLSRYDFPQSSESEGILKAIGLPLYS